MALSTSTVRSATLLSSRQPVLIVCDGASPDLWPLLRGGRHPLHAIAACPDPIEAITQRLQHGADDAAVDAAVEELHLVAHGRSGAFYLGGHWIDRARLIAASTSLASWTVARIILWSCHTGSEPAFPALLSELTGAEVHASATLLGVSDSLTITPHGVLQSRFALTDLFTPAAIEAWGGSLNGSVFVDGGGLSFQNGTKITSNRGNPVGTTYLYRDVYADAISGQRVDALVTVKGTVSATVSVFDSNTLQFESPGFFQPNVFIEDSDAPGGSAEFHFQFIDGSSSYTGPVGIPASSVTIVGDEFRIDGVSPNPYSKVTLENVSFTAYDIDGQSGNPTAEQFVQTQKYDPSGVIKVGSDVAQSFVGTALRFSATAPGDSDPNQTGVFNQAEFESHQASAGIGIMDSFDLTVGDFNNTSGSYVALYGISFGPAVPASLGDFLWNDSNGNGRQDVGEPGIPGRTVTLIGGGIDGVIGTGGDDTSVTTTTDGSGNYFFSRLTAGVQYQVIFDDIPDGTVFTRPDVSGNAFDTSDSDADPSTGKTKVIVLAQGENNTTIDAGVVRLASLGDRLWTDSNGNGIQDSGELGVSGESVTLIGGGADGLISTAVDNTSATITTDASGIYGFTNLMPGVQYQVKFSKPAGTVFTKQDVSGTDVIDSDVDASGLSQIVILSSGENNTTIDAGVIRLASLGDRLWSDSNLNGLQDSDELGVSGESVTLIGGGADGLISTAVDNTSATTTTDASGIYGFTNLTPGVQYQVKFSKPAGTVFTKQDVSGSDAIDSDVDASGLSQIVILSSGENNTTIDAGVIRLASLGDLLWTDSNGNGIQDSGELGVSGESVTLIGGGADGLINGIGDTTATITTDASGIYGFSGLTPGVQYQVKFSKPAGTVFTGKDQGSDDTKDSDADTVTGMTQIVTLSSGETNTSLDAGIYALASLGDRLWTDSNGNGIQDSGELGVSGESVTLIGGGSDGLINGIGDTTATTTTDASGIYGFSGLTPGVQYQVKFSKPAGTVFTGKDQGSDDTKDSDADTVTGMTQIVTLSSGETNTSLDAGIYALASLGDRLWTDSNGNGIQDSGELGVSGESVTLIGGGADGLISTAVDNTSATTTTDASGIYGFSGLMPGVEYQVKFSKPAGTVFTKQDVSGSDAIDSDVDASGLSQIVTLASGETNTTLDAGLIPANPGIKIIKDVVDQSIVAPNTPVTFSYSVTNTGGVALANIDVTDDNATEFAGDDFKPVAVVQTSGPYTGKNIGDINGNNLLDLTEIWKYSSTVIPPVVMTVTVTTGATPIDSGTLSYQPLANGDIRVYYRQSSNFNDNTYGTGSDSGWTSRGKTHRFSDLTNSDKAGFLIKYGDGTTLAQFYQDYITASTTQDKALDSSGNEYTAYSGYRSLGWSGGDGSWVKGSTTAQSWIKDFDSTLETNLNQPGSSSSSNTNGVVYTSMTVNSPIDDPKWDVVDGYSFVISKDAFAGGKTFGGVTIFDQHNSPAKVGDSNSYIPDIEGGGSVNTATVTGVGNGTNVTDSDDATVVVVTGPLGSIGDRVWLDIDADGVQDSSEAGIVGVKLTLNGDFNKDGNVDYTATATTDASGAYSFKNLPAGAYTVTVDTSTLPVNYIETYDLDGLATLNAATAVLANGQNRTDVDFGYVASAPGFSLEKTASKSSANYGEAITYTYVVKNTGAQALTNVVLTDDNGTPSDATDDFVLSGPSGDQVNPGSLDPSENWIYTKTLTPPITLGANNVNGYTGPAGQLSYQTLSNGDIRVTYRQSTNVNDNTYGTGISSGWSSHTFSDLTGSDKAGFELKDGSGNTVLKFYMDYISSTTTDTDGYGVNFAKYASLGATGGDGSMLIGSASNLYDFDSTLELNLNRAGYTKITTNSPVDDSNWDAVDGYSFTVAKGAFGTAGFGSVGIFDQHNSPSKLGVNSFVPTPTPGAVTNSAVVTAKLNGATVVAIDDATVVIGSGPTGPTKFFVTDNAADRTFLYSSLGTGTGSFANASGNGDARDIAANVAGDKLWVLDKNKNVSVYSGTGIQLGQWKADSQGREPEGLTLDPSIDPQTGKNDLWIADRDRKIYWYDDAASNTSGTDKAEKTFSPSISGNLKGIVTDGSSLWAVTEGSTDYVYRFVINRNASTGDPSSLTLAGSWTLAAVNSKPTGITLSLGGGSSLWVVDEGTDAVYEYGDGRTRTNGTGSLKTSFALGSTNLAPQGIADPITSVSATPGNESLDPIVSGGLLHQRQHPKTLSRYGRRGLQGREDRTFNSLGRLSSREPHNSNLADSHLGSQGDLGGEFNHRSVDPWMQSDWSFPLVNPANDVFG